uniref:Pogo transposable element derived with ZNF domain a n=1 Tax=Fundulus heteroclitus TaxID=8078 RepID=A0A146P697_FUNHE
MEVRTAAGVAADRLMECEEQGEKLSATPVKPNEKDERMDQETCTSVSMKNHKGETSPEPVRIVPIPAQPMTTASASSKTVKLAGSPLGFTVNGQPIQLLPGGGGAELRLHSHPEGSASGFTKIQIPVTLTLHSPLGTRYITTTASLTASSSLAPPPPVVVPPGPEPIPIITGVVSGEAAKKVLNDHSVNLNSSFQKCDKTPPSPGATSPKPKKGRTRPCPSRIAAPDKLLRKGEIGVATPPDCQICKSQYKLITELRGFMCMCCPVIADSLVNLRKQKIKRRRRARLLRKAFNLSREHPIFNKPPRIQPAVSHVKVITPPRRIRRHSDDVQSDDISSPSSPPLSPSRPSMLLPTDYPPSKLVIMVEDFFYGRAPGNSGDKSSELEGKYEFHCIHCSAVFSTNIKLMDHMQQHVSMLSQEDGHIDTGSTCPSCFRHFPSPFSLQCHVKDVHSQYESAVMCKICELAFDSEPALLCHMKGTHCPGEMPYACQVCEFRSSFYSDVWSHFREAHSDTRDLLCPYCLRVLHSNTCYQQHFARHQKKQKLSCDKCRLHFLYVRERAEHKALSHKTHVAPPQLSGLKPGTKVTVRMYSVVGGPERKEELNKVYIPSKVVDVAPPAHEQEVPKQRTVERLGTLLSGLSADGDFDPSQRCIECLKSIPDPEVHFPTLVHCSFCKFTTCCSNSYANHMINNHTVWKEPQFPAIYELNPRLPQALRCDSCTFSTFRGDAMANHMTERPDHVCITNKERILRHSKDPIPDSAPVSQKLSNGKGSFVPIQLLPPGQTSPQLSVKALSTAASPPFRPAMTIKVMGVGKQRASPLSHDQLAIVLSSLCHGISEIARRNNVSPATIRSWIALQQRGLAQRRWGWKTDKMAEWVLNRREQQLSVTETVLLLTARATLGESTQVEECYSWTIDFMLRHDLGLQTTNNNRLKSIRDNSRSFIDAIYAQIQKGVLPLSCWGCMDELPIFINLDLFSKQDTSAFQLFASPEDEAVFEIVLCALSDGRLLPPLLFFKGTASSIPDGFPDNVLLEAREEGFTEEERLQIWINKVWDPCVASKQDDESLLVMDVHRGHLSETFRDGLAAVNTDVAFIPAGCSCRLQPLEICVTQVLRDFLQARWSQLVSDGGLDGLGLDQLALTMACWLSEVSSTLNSQTDILRRSFTLACSLQHLENQGEAARMITALTEALTQPPESGSQEPGPKPAHLPTRRLEQERMPPPLLLVIKEEKKQGPNEAGKLRGIQREISSPSALFNSGSDADSASHM